MEMTCCSFFCHKARSYVPRRIIEMDEEVSSIQNTKMYTYKELKMATKDFSKSNKVGEGGFGCVYKGILEDGTLAAIKVLSAESKQGVKEFLTEIKVISEIEHENLVKLIGCCVEGRNRILVYGYLENNSLAQTLLSGSECSISFSWGVRRGICIGVAKGLAFLHEEVQPHIVHRDIKASNVLLDKDLNPKISDFGLAKLFPSNMTHISTKVAGTAGYLAPEYALRGQLNRKADIYSYGVLLLEIICGRCNTDRQLPPEQRYLLKQVWENHKRGEIVNVVDDAAVWGNDEVRRYLKIGLLCTQDTAKLRPSMSRVVKMLRGEIDVNNEKISRPGLLSEFRGLKVDLGGHTHTHTTPIPIQSSSTSSSNHNYGSSSSGDTSYATMTFNSMYNR